MNGAHLPGIIDERAFLFAERRGGQQQVGARLARGRVQVLVNHKRVAGQFSRERFTDQVQHLRGAGWRGGTQPQAQRAVQVGRFRQGNHLRAQAAGQAFNGWQHDAAVWVGQKLRPHQDHHRSGLPQQIRRRADQASRVLRRCSELLDQAGLLPVSRIQPDIRVAAPGRFDRAEVDDLRAAPPGPVQVRLYDRGRIGVVQAQAQDDRRFIKTLQGL